MLRHLKDVMRKLMEEERVKVRLLDMLSDMQVETFKYYQNFL